MSKSAELIHPIDGEVIQTDLDSLIGALRNVDEQIRALQALRATISALIAQEATPPEDVLFTRTTRIATENNRVVVKWPEPRFCQKTLKIVYADFPITLTSQYLSISGLRVRLTAFKQLVATTGGTAGFKKFRAAMLSARLNGELVPRISVELPKVKGLPNDLDFDDSDGPF
jgi:hypothetical protein